MKKQAMLVWLALLAAACRPGDAAVTAPPTVSSLPTTATTAPPTTTTTTMPAPGVAPVPADVAARSTWAPDCPVALDDLRYLTVPFVGFDGATHTGEMIVHASVADDILAVFTRIHEAGFPIAEMRVVSQADLDAPPTGDGNNTTGFVCRRARGSARWSDHALGLAVDVNPFMNPYVRGDVVLPELATEYVDRRVVRRGMLADGDVVTQAFAEIGWAWGGHWEPMKDWMHFSRSGR